MLCTALLQPWPWSMCTGHCSRHRQACAQSLTAASRRQPSDAAPETVLEAPEAADNFLSSTVILSKAIIGAGIAALPVTNALLGWPLASAALLLMAYATLITLRIIVRWAATCTPQQTL